MRALLSRFLEREGFLVVAVSSALELWAALEAQQPHLVLLDVELGEADGRDIVRRVRVGAPQVWCVAITAHTDPVLHESCLSAGFHRVLTKPLSRATLAQLVADFAATM